MPLHSPSYQNWTVTSGSSKQVHRPQWQDAIRSHLANIHIWQIFLWPFCEQHTGHNKLKLWSPPSFDPHWKRDASILSERFSQEATGSLRSALVVQNIRKTAWCQADKRVIERFSLSKYPTQLCPQNDDRNVNCASWCFATCAGFATRFVNGRAVWHRRYCRTNYGRTELCAKKKTGRNSKGSFNFLVQTHHGGARFCLSRSRSRHQKSADSKTATWRTNCNSFTWK